MRRKDREIGREAALDVVDRCTYAVLSVIDETGAPYGVPVSVVRDGENLYYHSAQEGKRTESLRLHPVVSLACVDKAERAADEFTVYYSSAIVRGTAVEITEEAEKLRALRLLCERYQPQLMERFADAAKALPVTAVWRIAIEEITGKCNMK